MTDAPLPYAAEDPNAYEWTRRAFELARDGRIQVGTSGASASTVEVNGPCPRCDDELGFTMSRKVVGDFTTKTLGSDSPPRPDEFVEITVNCQCRGTHDGRPSTEHAGCGINFTLLVRENLLR